MFENKNKTINKEAFDIDWIVFREFLIINRGHSQNPSAISSDKSRFNIIARWFDGKEWSTQNFTALLSCYKNNGRSQGTRNKLIAMGRNIDQFKETEIMKTFKTKVEKIQKIEEVLSKEEMFELAMVEIAYSKYRNHINYRQKAFIMLLATTGCRVGEALNLRWENIKNDLIRHVVFINTKNGSDRSVPINEDVFNLLISLQCIGEYVFVSGRGKKLSSGDINADLKKRAREIGLNKRVYPHLFRHSFATIMLESGVSEIDVCVMAGWHDQRMLMRYKSSNLEYYLSIMNNSPLARLEKTIENNLEVFFEDLGARFNPQQGVLSPNFNRAMLVSQALQV